MIPDEAIESAAKAAYELMPVELFGRDKPVTWEQLSDSPLGQRRKDKELTKARLTLEAAAPYMLAAAWDDGEAAGQDNVDSNRGYNIEHKHNPYRSAK